MKEIPILFSTPMVQAILEGRKSQTRRFAAVPYGDHHGTDIMDWGLSKHPYQENGKWFYSVQKDVDDYSTFELRSKYGEAGDLFWIREEHYQFGCWIEKEGVFTNTGKQKLMFVPTTDEVRYFNNKPENILGTHNNQFKTGWYKRLGRFMPKESTRIWLKKTGTKVERVSGISHEDAIAEGLACFSKDGGRTYKYGIPDIDGLPGIDDIGWPWDEWEVDPIKAFQKLWNKINGADTWNSWVWVNSFEILSTTGKPK